VSVQFANFAKRPHVVSVYVPESVILQYVS